MLTGIKDARKVKAPIRDKHDEDAKPRFVFMGVMVETTCGIRIFWSRKTDRWTKTMPATETLYRSGTPSGEMKKGDRASMSYEEFLDSHNPKFVRMVQRAVREALLER